MKTFHPELADCGTVCLLCYGEGDESAEIWQPSLAKAVSLAYDIGQPFSVWANTPTQWVAVLEGDPL